MFDGYCNVRPDPLLYDGVCHAILRWEIETARIFGKCDVILADAKVVYGSAIVQKWVTIVRNQRPNIVLAQDARLFATIHPQEYL